MPDWLAECSRCDKRGISGGRLRLRAAKCEIRSDFQSACAVQQRSRTVLEQSVVRLRSGESPMKTEWNSVTFSGWSE